jgi:hypothetical protein
VRHFEIRATFGEKNKASKSTVKFAASPILVNNEESLLVLDLCRQDINILSSNTYKK